MVLTQEIFYPMDMQPFLKIKNLKIDVKSLCYYGKMLLSTII